MPRVRRFRQAFRRIGSDWFQLIDVDIADITTMQNLVSHFRDDRYVPIIVEPIGSVNRQQIRRGRPPVADALAEDASEPDDGRWARCRFEFNSLVGSTFRLIFPDKSRLQNRMCNMVAGFDTDHYLDRAVVVILKIDTNAHERQALGNDRHLRTVGIARLNVNDLPPIAVCEVLKKRSPFVDRNLVSLRGVGSGRHPRKLSILRNVHPKLVGISGIDPVSTLVHTIPLPLTPHGSAATPRINGDRMHDAKVTAIIPEGFAAKTTRRVERTVMVTVENG